MLALCNLVLLTSFVDGVVGQVDEAVELVIGVFLGGKPCNAFVIYEYTQGIARGNQHVQSQIKLQVVNQVRVAQVSLHDKCVLALTHGVREGSNNVVYFSSEEYSLALTQAVWFEDQNGGFSFTLSLRILKRVQVFGQNPRLGKEVVLKRVGFLHLF